MDAHFTVNSKGKRTTSVGIPGTGLSYTTSSGGKKSKGKKTTKQQSIAKTTVKTTNTVSNTVNNTNKSSFKNVPLIVGIIFVVLGLSATNILMLALGALLIYIYWKDNRNQTTTKDPISPESNVSPSINETETVNDKLISDSLNIPTYLRQIEESIEIIGNSKNPDTVISRFDFLQGIYLKLSNTSDSVPNLNELSTHLQQVILEKNKYINASIKKALDDELIKINQLKTEKGKINRLHRFFEKMRTITDLPSENMAYIDKLEQETQI